MTVEEGPNYVLGHGQSLAEVAHKQMLALIEEGSWLPRSRLPSETELARHFGMSRPVIRQALAMLRNEGRIQSRQGSGSFVLGPSANPETPPDKVLFPTISSLADITAFVAFREGLEGEIAATAAANRTTEDLSTILSIMERGQQKRHLSDRSNDDFAFHLAVARASGNPFYVNSVTSLREQMLLGMGLIWNFSADSAEFRAIVADQHQAIYDALKRQDVEGAREAMRNHLKWASVRILRGDNS